MSPTYQVLARTWRPQTFDEMVGQDHVCRALGNAVASGRLAHAYVLAGLRGTGKTTVARILAKCLNCERGPTITPCGECDACHEIASSRALDVLEIDAASRTKVEQTRELLEMVAYAPARDRYKILIIDEAHMLSKASFNALLKTLEEPPPNVLFILATTELHKVLPTILSRCQVFEFRRVAVREVSAHLRAVAEAEKIRISDTALERIARAGEGSVRDALSVLERVLALAGTEVDDEAVLRAVGAVRSGVLVDFFRGLAARDAGVMLRVVDALLDEGQDLLHFWNELIAATRDLLLLAALPEPGDLLARSAEEGHALAEAAAGLSDEDLTRAFQLLADLETPLKSSSQPRFLFEAALIRLASLGAVRPIEELLARLGGTEASAALPSAPASRESQKKNRPAEGPLRADLSGATAGATAAARTPTATRAAAPTGSDLRARLSSALHDTRPLVAALVDHAVSLTLEGAEVVLRFGSEHEALRRQLERGDARAVLREQAERLVGRPLTLRIEAEASTPAPASAETVDSAPPPTAPAPRSARASLLEKAQRDPGVRTLLDTFGAQVVDIRPLAAEPLGEGDAAGPLEER